MASTSDFEEELNLSYHLLHHYGHTIMHSRLIDSHIYIMKKWIVDFLNRVSVQVRPLGRIQFLKNKQKLNSRMIHFQRSKVN